MIDSRITNTVRESRGWNAAEMWAFAALCMAGACATTARLDAKFDTDPLGARPLGAPPPNPPNDGLTWTTQRPLTSTVVADAAGGRWVRIAPLPAFVASPDPRQLVLLASTEPLTTSPPAQLRGAVRLRLDGLGTILIAFQPVQGARPEDYIAGIELGTFLGPTAAPAPRSSLTLVRGFAVHRLNDIFALPAAATIANPSPGTVVSLSWSIDQTSRTFSVSAGGGSTQSLTFPLPAPDPIDQVRIEVWMQRPTSGTVAFIDDLFAEEYK